MKKIALVVATSALVMIAGSSYAANSLNAGTFGLGVSMVQQNVTANGQTVNNPLIQGKYSITRDIAVLGGFGFLSGGPSGNSTTTFSLLGGVRKYLKVDDFAPFVGGVLEYSSTSSAPSSSSTLVAAEGGAEYFLAKQFSVEGKVRIGYLSTDSGTIKSTYFGTTTVGAGLNFYF